MTVISQDKPSSVLPALRSSTRDVHLRLHVHPLMRNLVRRCLTPEEYVTVLYALDRFHDSVRDELSRLPGTLSTSSRTRLLKQDYKHITGNGHNPLTPCPALALEHSQDARLGLLYVLEGSRQGGRVIAMNIRKALGFDSHGGAAFFNHEHSSTGEDWNAFSRKLETQCSNKQVCIDAAQKTFLALESYLWLAHGEKAEDYMLQALV